jgi:hypothetical protein
MILSYGILRGIWTARNKLMFEDKILDWNVQFQLILHRHTLRLKASSNNFTYTSNNLIRGTDGNLSWTNK